MTVSNFLRAYAECEIRDTEDGRWLYNSQDFPFMSGVTIIAAMQAGGFGIPTITVSFEAPYLEGLALLEGGCFRAGNKVAVRIGYVGDPLATPWYWGQLSNGGDGLTLTDQGLSGSITAQALAESSWYDVPAADLTNKNILVLYAMIAQRMGCKLWMSPTAQAQATLRQPDPGSGPEAWGNVPASRSAWEWLLYLNSSQMCNLDSTIAFAPDGTRMLYVLTKTELSRGGMRDADGMISEMIKRRTYRMRGAVRPDIDEYPIFSWGPDPGLAKWDGMLPPGGAGATRAAVLNPFSGKIVAPISKSQDQDEAVASVLEDPGAEGGPLSFDDFLSELDPDSWFGKDISVPAPQAVDDAAVKEKAKAVAKGRQGEGNAAQKATIASVGVPTEFPGNIINVAGCSRRYDDAYQVWNVTHNWAGGIWDMTLALLRHGYPDEFAMLGSIEPAVGTVPKE